MARIAGVNVPLNKRVEVGLTYVYGIGRATSNKLLAEAGVDPNTLVRDLTEDEVVKIRDLVERDLTVEVEANDDAQAIERAVEEVERRMTTIPTDEVQADPWASEVEK